ncbi:hypothetical protein [Elioraea tepidiphila]|uniref:hypothetical protein n=1 Tax=Elioraea tepidiphila TaxID=457934 RepID=UPI0003824333|nr:hypothetical protein [Elioraea tepidiphila]
MRRLVALLIALVPFAAPTQACEIAGEPGWTPVETRVWQALCGGRTADLRELGRTGGDSGQRPDPAQAGTMPEARFRLSAGFLRAVFGNPARARLLADQPIEIHHARLVEPLDLAYLRPTTQIVFRSSRFERGILMRGLDTHHRIAITESWVGEAIDLTSATVRSSIELRGLTIGEAVNGLRFAVQLGFVSVGGNLALSDVEAKGGLNLDTTRVAANAFLTDLKITGELFAVGLAIGGSLNAVDVTVANRVALDRADIAGSAILRNVNAGQRFSLVAARIGRSLRIWSGRVGRGLDLDSARIEGDAELSHRADPTTAASISAERATIGGMLSLNAAVIGPEECTDPHRRADAVALDDAVVGRGLSLDQIRTCGGIAIRGARVGGDLWLESARIDGSITGDRMRVGNSLFARRAEVAREFRLIAATIDQDVDIGDGAELGTLLLDTAHVGRRLFVYDAHIDTVNLDAIALTGAARLTDVTVTTITAINGTIEGGLWIADARGIERLDLTRARIGAVLDLSNVILVETARPASLVDARVDGSATICRATFPAWLDLTRLRVTGSLEIGATAAMRGLVADGATIGGNLVLTGSHAEGCRAAVAVGGPGIRAEGLAVHGSFKADTLTVDGPILLERLAVHGDVFIRAAALAPPADTASPIGLRAARIGGDLDLSCTVLPGLDLSLASVAGRLALGTSDECPPARKTATQWRGDATLSLRNASVAILHYDRIVDVAEGLSPLPTVTDLRDVNILAVEQVARHLEGYRGPLRRLWAGMPLPFRQAAAAGGSMVSPVAIPFILKWPQGEMWSPAPFHDMAARLNAMGLADDANAFLLDARLEEAERAWDAGDHPRAAWRWFLIATIGHGYGSYMFVILVWITILLVLGVVLPRLLKCCSAEHAGTSVAFGLTHSIDRLLPFSLFDDAHHKARPEHTALRWYFGVHRAAGLVLLAILIAAVTGQWT